MKGFKLNLTVQMRKTSKGFKRVDFVVNYKYRVKTCAFGVTAMMMH